MNPRLQTLYGLKFHPFRPDVPLEALYTTPAVDSFIRRVEVGVADGGFVMIRGGPHPPVHYLPELSFYCAPLPGVLLLPYLV